VVPAVPAVPALDVMVQVGMVQVVSVAVVTLVAGSPVAVVHSVVAVHLEVGKYMSFLNDNDKQRIAEAIEQAERKTRGEFVTVIAQAADDYLYIPTLWAALIALLVPGVVEFSAWPWTTAYSYELQVFTFVICTLLFRWTPIKRRLIPKSIKYQRAHRLAHEQFFQQNLHHTDERTGVLLFVSITEHYVEIIADKGINDVVHAGVWDEVVNDFIRQVKAGQVTTGFLHAVKACGDILAEHFPGSEENRNELPNHLIEI